MSAWMANWDSGSGDSHITRSPNSVREAQCCCEKVENFEISGNKNVAACQRIKKHDLINFELRTIILILGQGHTGHTSLIAVERDV